jgi:transcriptional regulator with XRE-family HTH domain
MPTARLRIGEALAHLRRQRGLSQRELAVRRGVIPQSISKVETQNPTVRTIEEYLSALGATPEDFLRALASIHEIPIRGPGQAGAGANAKYDSDANEAFDRMMEALREFRRAVQGESDAHGETER